MKEVGNSHYYHKRPLHVWISFALQQARMPYEIKIEPIRMAKASSWPGTGLGRALGSGTILQGHGVAA